MSRETGVLRAAGGVAIILLYKWPILG